jgi:hypothetical protein
MMAEFGLKQSKMVEERDWNHHGMRVWYSDVSTNLHGANLFWSALLFPQTYIFLTSSGQRR